MLINTKFTKILTGIFLIFNFLMAGSNYSILAKDTNDSAIELTKASFSLNNMPVKSVASGDLNNNGKADLVVLTSEYIISLLGDNSGTKKIAASASATKIYLKDLNSDERDDLLVLSSGKVNIYVNHDGEFTDSQAFNTGINPNNLVAQDFNKDGLIDILVSDANSNTLTLLLNTKNGIFEKTTIQTAGKANSVNAFDLNKNGSLDIVLGYTNAAGNNKLGVYKQTATGKFTEGLTLNLSEKATGISIGDVNKDNKQDVIISTNGQVGVILGKENGLSANIKYYSVAGNPISVILANLNNDNYPEIVTLNQDTKNISILRGDREGFAPSFEFNIDAEPSSIIQTYLEGKPGLVIGTNKGLTEFIQAQAADSSNQSTQKLKGSLKQQTAPAPTITSIYPNNGMSGDSITITGTNFISTSNVLAVKFGDNTLTADTYMISQDGTQITATVPAGGTGKVNIQVVTSNGTSLNTISDDFTYTTAPRPTITSIFPNKDVASNTISINGSNFTGVNSVKFGIASANIVSSTDSLIRVKVPGGIPNQTVNIIVSTLSGGTSLNTSSDDFTYSSSAQLPKITSIEPPNGMTGDSLTITGTNFAGIASLKFGDSSIQSSSYTVSSDGTSITISSLPSSGTGKVDVQIITSNGTSQNTISDDFTYTTASRPAITSLSPNADAINSIINVNGSNFTGVSSVKFGSANATIVSSTDSLIRVKVPGSIGQKVDVRVYSPSGGTSLNTSSDDFTYSSSTQLPRITSIEPANGMTGDSITIVGTNLAGTTSVKFGDSSIQSSSYTVSSGGTSITISSLPSSGTGKVNVQVITPLGTSQSSEIASFTYTTTPRPSITSLFPNVDAVNNTISINGSNLSGVTSVKFGTAIATIVSSTDSLIKVKVPSNNSNKADVRVYSPSGGTSLNTSSDDFTYSTTTMLPKITSIEPANGMAGDSVIIMGSNFISTNNVKGLYFGNLSIQTGSYAVSSDGTQITTTVPSGGNGKIYVSVTTDYGTSQNTESASFTYLTDARPTITSIFPNKDIAGNTISINGSNFTGVNSVKFGIASASIISSTDSLIRVKVPGGIPNQTVNVIVSTLQGGTSLNTSSDDFTYSATAPLPQITSIEPPNGMTGDSITINGTNLAGTASVKFGDSLLQSSSYTVSTDGKLITISSLPSSGNGKVDVQVITSNGTSQNKPSDDFTYTTASRPAISSLFPNKDIINNIISINGSNFTGVSSVKFGIANATIVSLTDSLIRVKVPGTIGQKVDVRVYSPSGGTSLNTSSDDFTYSTVTILPKITSVEPPNGMTGDSITITGTNFTGATSVRFGDSSLPASSYTVSADGKLITISSLPSSGNGRVDVQVITSNGTSQNQISDDFTYTTTPRPSITSLFPNVDVVGNTISINGSNLSGVTSVKFGSAAATIISSTDSLIRVKVPPNSNTSTQKADIRVHSPTGGISLNTASDDFTYNSY